VFSYVNSEISKGAEPHSTRASAVINNLPLFFAGLAKSEIEDVLSSAVQRKYQRGALLYAEGEAANEFFLLLSGRARYFTLTEDGRRVILRWILPNEVIGVMALLNDPRAYLASAESVRDSEILVWRREDIRRLTHCYPRVFENVLATAPDYFNWYIADHLALISDPAPKRLARVLSRVARDIGQHEADGVVLDITNEKLADAAHITRFSTSRFLSEWQRKGILRKRRGKLVLVSSERLLAVGA
jgi:CRP/FNR family transcriptional regulator, nitrogen oxide reductase regulator